MAYFGQPTRAAGHQAMAETAQVRPAVFEIARCLRKLAAVSGVDDINRQASALRRRARTDRLIAVAP